MNDQQLSAAQLDMLRTAVRAHLRNLSQTDEQYADYIALEDKLRKVIVQRLTK